MLALALVASASALTSPQSGPGAELAVGLGLGGERVAAHVGGVAAVGWWFGHYDDQYSLGRYWWVGPAVRADWRPGGVRIAPLLEVRRGVDLLVVGVAPLIAAGPVWSDGTLGWTARLGLIAELRRTRSWSADLRLEAGVEVFGSAVGFSGAALVGGSFSRPARYQSSGSRPAEY